MFCVVLCKAGREEGFRNIHTYSQYALLYASVFFMALRLSAWHGTHPYGSVAFFSFFLSVSFFPLIHPINPSNHHPIPSTLIQQRLALFSSVCTSHPSLYLLVSSHSTFLQVLKYFFFLRSNHPSPTLYSLSFSPSLL
jgi:hypothetical protein